MPFSVGPLELVALAFVAAILCGPRRFPEIVRKAARVNRRAVQAREELSAPVRELKELVADSSLDESTEN